MVSSRCKMIVDDELKKLGITTSTIELGVVQTVESLSTHQRAELKSNLSKSGLWLLDDKKSILIDRIKNVIIEMVHCQDDLPKENYSDYISQKLNYDYTYLSNLFSQGKGITIQQFIITHKVEKIKELMLYNELTLIEIADRLHYSSAAHLSNQFKKITGLSPSFFKKLRMTRESNLEDLGE